MAAKRRTSPPKGSLGAVLVVDDSEVARRAVSRRFGTAGFLVIEAESLAAASTLEARRFLCAILDLELPDGDGTMVARALRARIPSMPVAFLTGGAEPEVLSQARLLGPVFTKPEGVAEALVWALSVVPKPGP